MTKSELNEFITEFGTLYTCAQEFSASPVELKHESETMLAISLKDVELGKKINVRLDEPTQIQQIALACEGRKNAKIAIYIPNTNTKDGSLITEKNQIESKGYLAHIFSYEITKSGAMKVELLPFAIIDIEDIEANMINEFKIPFIQYITFKQNSPFEFHFLSSEEDLLECNHAKEIIENLKSLREYQIKVEKNSTSFLAQENIDSVIDNLFIEFVPDAQHKDVKHSMTYFKYGIIKLIHTISSQNDLSDPELKKLSSAGKDKFNSTELMSIPSIQLLEKINEYYSMEAQKSDLSTKLDYQIEKKLKSELDKQQQDYILREKIRIMKNLIEGNNKSDSKSKKDDKFKVDNELGRFPEEVVKVIKEEKEKLSEMMPSSPNADITKAYIDVLNNLPWRRTSIFNTTINKAKDLLEEEHYGLEQVKKRIVEYIAIAIRRNEEISKIKENQSRKINEQEEINFELFKNSNSMKNKTENYSPILTLVGPPGTGKTSLAKSIAKALGRKLIKISLGGVHDEAEIRGHRRTYVGAMPGKIINAINKAGVSNPVILLDEIDKMSSDRRGDPTSALLEVLDPEQNSHFQDNYVELEYDLSEVMFVATANYYENIPAALIDRVEIIELNSYTVSEKIKIARQYLIDRVLKQNYADSDLFEVSDEMLKFIIKHYTMEAGVRGLYRELDKIVRRITVENLAKSNKKVQKIVLDEKKIIKYLGTIKIDEQSKANKPQIGSVNGLAFTSYGGSTLEIEVTTYPGRGELKLTGQLKDVMQESAQIAATYVRANASKFGIKFDFEKNNIHIHVPEGATPKDGPSAGVTFTTAIISALSKKPVDSTIGMTGEITLRGKVLEIGGLKEKSFAANQKGIKTVFIPMANKKNLQDIPKEVTSEIEYIPVQDYMDIYKKIFK